MNMSSTLMLYHIMFVVIMFSRPSEAWHHRLMPCTRIIHSNTIKIQINSSLSFRGGSKENLKTNKAVKKKGGRKKKSQHKATRENEKHEPDEIARERINQTMKRHKDSASMLGDAIRDRAHDLIHNDLHTKPSSILNSLGLALGATGTPSLNISSSSELPGRNDEQDWKTVDDNDSGGVEAASSAVLANYFLHTHGGFHGIQSVLSLSSVASAIGAMLSPSYTSSTTKVSTANALNNQSPTSLPNFTKLMLIRRTLLFACFKHASGILSAIFISAKQIPDIGLSQARKALEQLIVDPVAQYFFYCCLMMLWTGLLPIGGEVSTSSSSGSISRNTNTMSPMPWWLHSSSHGRNFSSLTTLCIIGPILIREFVSTVWVLSDVFVILSVDNPLAYRLWKLGGSVVDAIMSLLFTPLVWKNSNLVARQKLLAELVSRVSLLLEVLTGLLIVVDSVSSFLKLSMVPVMTRSSFWRLVLRIVCARLYTQFLLVRRQRIMELMTTLRGGAAHLPDRVLDTLLDPRKAMGLDVDIARLEENSWDRSFQTWIQWIGILLGF